MAGIASNNEARNIPVNHGTLLLKGVLAGCLIGRAVAAESPMITTSAGGGVRIEKREVPGGGELFTYFQTVPNFTKSASGKTEIPAVSILRDTLGDDDPANDRLRQVWSLTYSRPSIFKRAAAAIPFLYHRAGWSSPSGMPPALIDMSAPAKGTTVRVFGNLLQSSVLDPLGAPYRATTRAYRSRSGEYRAMNLWRTAEVLSADEPAGANLSEADLDQIRGRLLLARKILGGLVDDAFVVPAWNRFESNLAQARGHNWELLRQRAEENHLYFQPLEHSATGGAFAVIWVNHADVGANFRFEPKFLDIADPFTDSRVRRWKDYSQLWWLDDNGTVVSPDAEAAHPAVMIPLALYSLDHPRAPLLLVDFRDPGKPRRREMVRRAADDVATGVLGWTGFGHWSYLGVKTSWSFIQGRHGAAVDRDARLKAYVQLRELLQADEGLTPDFRSELRKRTDKLDMNPFENASHADQSIAERQYAALLRKLDSGALSSDLARQRAREAEPLMHSAMSRGLRRTAAVFTFGVYRHHDAETLEQRSLVDIARRIAWHRRFLQDVLDGGARPEVVADVAAVRHSLSELTRLSAELPETRERSSKLVAAILARLTPIEEAVAGGQ